jgi:hypothetical protein
VNKLVLNIPDGYNIEINDYLKLKVMQGVSNIQFVDFVSTINNLRELEVQFNSMESSTFGKILYLIKNNKNLQKLKINFLPQENAYFSIYQLLKIEEDNILREMQKRYKDNNNKSLNGLLIHDDIKDDYTLRQKALDNLQKSYEKFFLLLQMMKQKTKLENLTLEINKPFHLIDKTLHWIILKLFFNILLDLNRENVTIKELNLIFPDLNLDNSYYTFIHTFFDRINLHEKNPELNTLYLRCQISNISNLGNLISYNLNNIYIGDLDVISFKSFVNFYHSKEFKKYSKLKALTLCLNKTVSSFRECKDEISDLITGKNPKLIYNLTLSMHFNIGHEELLEVMTKANGNHIIRYTFVMEMSSEKDYANLFKNANLFYLNQKLINNISKYIPILKKYNFLEGKKKKISKRLFLFLIASNKKKLFFKKIEE